VQNATVREYTWRCKTAETFIQALFGGFRTWIGDQIRIPRVVITFFSPPLPKTILKTAELQALCNVVSSIYQLFVPHFAMSVFMRIYLQYGIKNSGTRRLNSPQFS